MLCLSRSLTGLRNSHREKDTLTLNVFLPWIPETGRCKWLTNTNLHHGKIMNSQDAYMTLGLEMMHCMNGAVRMQHWFRAALVWHGFCWTRDIWIFTSPSDRRTLNVLLRRYNVSEVRILHLNNINILTQNKKLSYLINMLY